MEPKGKMNGFTLKPYRTLNLQTLDTGVCAGKMWLSNRIAWLQKLRGFEPPASLITHVFKIVKMPAETAELLGVYPDKDNLYVCETTTLNKWTTPPKRGLQINRFDRWLRNYNGHVGVRRWKFTRTENWNREVLTYIFKLLRDPKKQKYENGIPGAIELTLCEFGIKKAILETAELHCTEFNGTIDMYFKLIASGIISSNRLPPCEYLPYVIQRGKLRKGLVEQLRLEPAEDEIQWIK